MEKQLRLVKQRGQAPADVGMTMEARMDSAYRDMRMAQLHARIRELCQEAQDILRYPLRAVRRDP